MSMNTFQMRHLENILNNEEISEAYLKLFRQRQKQRVYQLVLKLFLEEAEKGLTKKDLAKKIGKNAAQVTRWFSGPSNWTLDTVSDLLIAMGSEMNFEAKHLTKQPTQNYKHPVVTMAEKNNLAWSLEDSLGGEEKQISEVRKTGSTREVNTISFFYENNPGHTRVSI